MSPSLANFYANQAAFAKGQARWDNAAEPETPFDDWIDAVTAGMDEAQQYIAKAEQAIQRHDFRAVRQALSDARECLEEPK